MKKIIIGIIVFAVALLSPQIVQAQGTMTYLSNMDQASAGSLAVGSDSWLATDFGTGNNASGYTLDSVQLGMADASGSPSSFVVMIYAASFGAGISPGSSLGSLNGSLNPTTAGIYTYTPASNLTLSPGTDYFIVLTAGTAIANGAYDWSYTGVNSYSPSSGWTSWGGDFSISSDGSHWNSGAFIGPQFAINAIPVPEPGVLGFFGLGGLAFLWHRRKAKAD